MLARIWGDFFAGVGIFHLPKTAEGVIGLGSLGFCSLGENTSVTEVNLQIKFVTTISAGYNTNISATTSAVG